MHGNDALGAACEWSVGTQTNWGAETGFRGIPNYCFVIKSIPRGTLNTTVGGSSQQTNLSTEGNNKN